LSYKCWNHKTSFHYIITLICVEYHIILSNYLYHKKSWFVSLQQSLNFKILVIKIYWVHRLTMWTRFDLHSSRVLTWSMSDWLALEYGPKVCSETSVNKYRHTLPNDSEHWKTHLHRRGDLKILMDCIWLRREPVSNCCEPRFTHLCHEWRGISWPRK
jgi:hypothetical protein